MSSSQIIDGQLLDGLPRNLAAAWRDVLNASNDDGRLRSAVSSFELGLRIQVAWALTAYPCCAQRSDVVDRLFAGKGLPVGGRLSLGHWLERLNALARHLRQQPDHPLVGGFDWLVQSNGSLRADVAQLHDKIVAGRNRVLAHPSQLQVSGSSLRDACAELVDLVRQALHRALILRSHRMVVLRNVFHGRSDVYTGDVDALVGATSWRRGQWRARLVGEGEDGLPPVFLIPPDGSRFIDLFPFVSFGLGPDHHSMGLQFLNGFDVDSGGVRLIDPATGSGRSALLPLPTKDATLESWLAASSANHRAAHPRNEMPTAPFVHEDPPKDLDGTILCGRYELGDMVGEGATAKVYRARCRHLRREFAVKVLDESLLRDPDVRERFRREVEILAGIQHPNLPCDVDLDCDQATGRWVLRMEFLGGGTLRAQIAKGPTAESEVMAIACAGFAALAALHAKGIIHRDVKPANFMKTADGRVVLIDLGVALMTDARMTRTHVSLGTLAYMAPEASRSGAVLTDRADIYAFGKVLTELLRGEELDHTERPGDGVAGRLTDLLVRMGSQQPIDRPSASEALSLVEAMGIHRPPSQIPQAPQVPQTPWSIVTGVHRHARTYDLPPYRGEMSKAVAMQVVTSFADVAEPWRTDFAAWMVLAAWLAHRTNAQEWAATLKSRLEPRIHVGGFNLITVQAGNCWLALDSETLNRDPRLRSVMASNDAWRTCAEYPHYSKIPTLNGDILPVSAAESLFDAVLPAFEKVLVKASGRRKSPKTTHNATLAEALGALSGLAMPAP